jgi:hypothetical protein
MVRSVLKQVIWVGRAKVLAFDPVVNRKTPTSFWI